MSEDLKESIILSQLIQNPYYRDKVLTYLRPSFFNDEKNKKLFKAIHKLVIKDKIKLLDRKTLNLKYKDQNHIEDLFDLHYPSENTDFLIQETEVWGKDCALKDAVLRTVDIIQETDNKEDKEERESISNIIKEAMAFSFDSDLGLNYFKDIKRRFDYYGKSEDKISTGYKLLDMYTNGGLPKKTLTVIAGSSGLGKTLFGTNLYANMIAQNLTGIYITLELAEEVVARRIDSCITKIPYYNLPNERENVEKILSEFKGEDPFIKEYPPSKASSSNLKMYIKELEVLKKIKPDFLFVDYIQLVKPNSQRSNMNSFEKYKEVAEELREIGQEYDIPVITFSQVQREGYANNGMGLTNIADSMGIVNAADLVIGMTQTPAEEEDNLQTWKIIKNRMGRRGVEMRAQMHSDILKFTEIINDEERTMLEDYELRNKDFSKKPIKKIIKKDMILDRDNEEIANVPDEFNKFVEASNENINDIYKDFS